MAIKEDTIDRVLGMVNKLPPMPDNVVKLRKVCADPNVRFKDFVPLIEQDPGLCADILHMSNSAHFGVGHPVETISEAVRFFGMDHLVDFVSISFSEKVVRKYFSGIRDLNEYFRHSRTVSLAAKILAKKAGKSAVEQEFYAVAGLLHDIGRLILIIVGDDESAELIGNNWEYIEDLVHKEQELLGIDHCNVGNKICGKWQFSEKLQEAVLRHHTPILTDDFNEEAAFVLLAHFVSMTDFPIDMLLTVYPEDIIEKMGLSIDRITAARSDYIELEKAIP